MRLTSHWYHRRNIVALIAVTAAVALIYSWGLAAPADFPANKIIKIESGRSVREVAELLSAKNIVAQPEIFIALMRVFGGEKGVIAGGYYFDRPLNVLIVAKRLSRGEFNLTPIKVTLPEGTTTKEMSRILAKSLPEFDPQTFATLTKDKEGYLFPDTYYFLPTTTTEEIVEQLTETFKNKTAALAAKALWSKHSFHDIIIMASLLEEEAKTFSDRKMIAGILWKRLAAGMRLQVDAVFPYIIGKNTFQVTKSDLRVNSPYNTYRYAGLPAGPITNPGLEAIMAALDPTPSPYWYYLTGQDGKMYYSEDFDGHKDNRVNYLD